MAFAGHQHDHALGLNEVSFDDDKGIAQHVSSDDDLEQTTMRSRRRSRRREAPELVRNLSPEERERLERALVAKIDLRLLPMIILMYIMNYLDRNNIASARLAGLEDDLKLSSVQYNVGCPLLPRYLAIY